jgi:hypothetical protein
MVTSGAAADALEKLATLRHGRVKLVKDTPSVARFELTLNYTFRDEVPVSVLVFKEEKRVRVRVLKHDLSREWVERVVDDVAAVFVGQVVDRSTVEEDRLVKEAIERAQPASQKVTRRRAPSPPTPAGP